MSVCVSVTSGSQQLQFYVWLKIMDSFVTNCIAGKDYCDYSSVMKSRIISTCMCKTMTDLCIQSARVQHFSAFVIIIIHFVHNTGRTD